VKAKLLVARHLRGWKRNLHLVEKTLGGHLRRLTFELSGRRRQDAGARAVKMYGVPQAGPWWTAVGAPLERGVRPQRTQDAIEWHW
jgi:hypothetical protein